MIMDIIYDLCSHIYLYEAVYIMKNEQIVLFAISWTLWIIVTDALILHTPIKLRTSIVLKKASIVIF